MTTARALALDTALRRAGVATESGLDGIERFLATIDPDGDPRVPDEALIEQVVEFFAELCASARATEMAETMLARAARRR